jgi:two-component sensor histidine kinase
VQLGKAARGGQIKLSVSDGGRGLPPDIHITEARSLGMKIIRALLEQMGAALDVRGAQPGTEFIVTIPLDAQG